MNSDLFWQTKLHARLHDPAEKALVLLRDPAGHEGGTSRALHRLLGYQTLAAESIDPDNAEVLHKVLFEHGIPRVIYETVRRADWWASAADRPQWPMQEITVKTKTGETRTLKVADWAQVRWTQRPVLIHPLTGEMFDLGEYGSLSDTAVRDIKQRSFAHLSGILDVLAKQGAQQDWRKILLAFWRFGPELSEDEDFGKLGQLWRLLPADTRVPDHSIWEHLDLVSAFAGAFAADPDGEAALLALSIGPVQSFIEAARTTSDLWAGSHLLSRLAWEAMAQVCKELGPDAILFPRLRGVPQADLWLRDECGLPHQFFEKCEWMSGATDSNPLFSAALPNRFVAVVPRAQARDLPQLIAKEIRGWLQRTGELTVDRLLEEAKLRRKGEPRDVAVHAYQQMRQQLDGFPEVHWAIVPFSLVRPRNREKQTDLDTATLSAAMAPFFGVAEDEPSGFLDSPAWKVLQRGIELNGAVFFDSNPGVLYPAIYDLAERVLAAAKTVRPFDQTEQNGWRCSLTGETEWLTTDPVQLEKSYRHKTDTLWARVAQARPAWAKKGEHLGALSAIKRLWPTLFVEEVRRALGDREVGRFVVSTHTMALAHQLDRWLERGGLAAEGLTEALARYKSEPVALPPKLVVKHRSNSALGHAKCLPALLDLARELDDEAEARRVNGIVKKTLATCPANDEEVALEKYYALLLMDGDHMGKWLSGGARFAISYLESFHPDVRAGFARFAEGTSLLAVYGAEPRALSPNRHLAISGALNDFSLTVVRHVIENEHLGRVLYAGGDDVLAMLPVADLLPAMKRLRQAYSGHDLEHEGGVSRGLTLHNGFAALREGKDIRVMRMMGTRATASCGAVIAHHQAPLGAVLRELREAEKRAKNEGGRDAFSLTVIKRSGGALFLTARWGEPLALLLKLRNFLADPGVSRRAVFNSAEWLTDLPEPDGDAEMLRSMLAYQLARQTEKTGRGRHDIPDLASGLAQLCMGQKNKRLVSLVNFMSVAEFLARETRAPGQLDALGERQEVVA
jgi:CRISPR-associated protein Cmr2